MLRTSITPHGTFLVGVHKPCYEVANLREKEGLATLGEFWDGTLADNQRNFPAGDIREEGAHWIYEIPNAFPFRGTTYIDGAWAASRAQSPASIRLASAPECSLFRLLGDIFAPDEVRKIFSELPRAVLYALAANSTDGDELVLLARNCCRMMTDGQGLPNGLRYVREENGQIHADVDDFELFETIANNPHLPDSYKEVMVLRPGVQGDSEIVGEFAGAQTHVYEYLRRNSYIPWGHYAANMASDAIRYQTTELSAADMTGLRHLYYQRIYVTVASSLGLELPRRRHTLTELELENLRRQIVAAAATRADYPATLWGWNFGYDISASGYRLHASHQMIHQQYALVPHHVECLAPAANGSATMPSYSCGDMVAEVVERYRSDYSSDFFSDYVRALRGNERLDGGPGPASLIVWEDANVLLFVPKAQVSQWELQLMVLADTEQGPVGNVVEADSRVRESLDQGLLIAQKIFASLGAKLVTTIEFSKRIGIVNDQRLLYSFLPKLPWSMGAFSEAQLRFISSHFPEDFASCCRTRYQRIFK